MVNSYVFCSTATGLSGRTALGAKKTDSDYTAAVLSSKDSAPGPDLWGHHELVFRGLSGDHLG